MKYLLTMLSITISIMAMRDPFSYSDGVDRYVCGGIGNIGTIYFAYVYKNGTRYFVRCNDTIDDSTVLSITDSSVLLQHSTGKKEKLILN